MSSALHQHLKTGDTTVCHAWLIQRRDGVQMGFTDHDLALSFEGYEFCADTGLSALALQQATGLSIDNTEAIGALSDASISEADIDAGRYDGAEVTAWLVNWTNVADRKVLFRGSLGELRRSGGAFEAELRGLTDVLNRPVGRVYQKPCTAVLGDRACGFDPMQAGYFAEVPLLSASENILELAAMPDFADGWFERGSLTVLDGTAKDINAMIKRDYTQGAFRIIELWQAPRAPLGTGDSLRLIAGCDRRFDTCRFKFENALNFQGFPDLPSDDWAVSVPVNSPHKNGGSLR